MMSPSPLERVAAAPLTALALAGYGTAGRPVAPLDARRLRTFLDSPDSVHLALESCGAVAGGLLTILAACGGRLDALALAYQTRSANPAELDATLDRLETTGIVTRGRDGSVAWTSVAARRIAASHRSMAEPNAIVNDDLALVCRTLGIEAPERKTDRLAAIRATFADQAARQRIRDGLSIGALVLFDDLVRLAGHLPIDAAALGLSYWELSTARFSRYPTAPGLRLEPGAEALRELVRSGIVGVDTHESQLWIWAEAWPLAGRPIVEDWSSASRPPLGIVSSHGEAAVPSCIGVLDRLLDRWAEQPPAVLKNGDARLGKTDARTLAKAVSADPVTVEVLGRIVIGMRLALADETGRSGRGRNLRIDQAWCLDADLHKAWTERPPLRRWVRLVAEWCSPTLDADPIVLANRHLVLWELQQLGPTEAYVGDDAFAAWIEDRHGPIAQADRVAEIVTELRALGVVTATGVALTGRGRLALADPAAVTRDDEAGATRAFVQTDLTVVAPPDLRHDLVLALDRIAVVESTGGVTIHRLDAGRITRAVQAGDTPEGIVALLEGLAGTVLPDTVTRLVHDAAAGAASVRLATASTVVVVDDPAQLTTACAIKSLRLTRLAPNVAVTDVALAKVQAALVTKGLAPKVTATATPKAARSNAALAEAAEREAAELRARFAGANPFIDRYAGQLEARAAELRDVDARFAVPTALTLTPEALRAVTEGRPVAPPDAAPGRSAKPGRSGKAGGAGGPGPAGADEP